MSCKTGESSWMVKEIRIFVKVSRSSVSVVIDWRGCFTDPHSHCARSKQAKLQHVTLQKFSHIKLLALGLFFSLYIKQQSFIFTLASVSQWQVLEGKMEERARHYRHTYPCACGMRMHRVARNINGGTSHHGTSWELMALGLIYLYGYLLLST